MSCKECKRSCRASLLCAACEKREQAVLEELGKAASKRASEQIWNSVVTQDGVSIGTAACTNVPRGLSPLASALPLCKSILDEFKELEKQSIPFRPAYLFIPPELMSQIPMATFDSPEFDAPLRFKVMMDYNVKLMTNSMMIPRSLLYSDCCGSGQHVAPVVWKDVKQPAKPSALIWCVVVAFLCWLMCAAAGVL